MATWNPSNVILTLKGNEILSKVQAGIGSLKVSRIVSGAGFVSPSQLYKQTAVSNIKQVFSITEVNTDSNGSEIAITLDNKDLDEGYELYQIGVYVTHQDYQGEVLYTIAQCDVDSPDTIPSPSVTVAVFQYSLYLEHSNVSDVTININPDGYVTIDRIGAKNGVASLDSSGKVPVGQIPKLDYDPLGSADEVRDDLNSHVSNYKNPHRVSAKQTGAIPSDQKGSNDGVAELDSFGHVPPEQMPGYSVYQGIQIMGKESAKGNVIIDSIHGNTVLSGVPSYNSPVELNSVEGPLSIHVSGKNILSSKWNIDTQTQFGVTCTRDDDKFSLSGTSTATGGINFYIQRYDTESALFIPPGTYTISGVPSNNNNLFLGLYRRLSSDTNEQIATCYGIPSKSKPTFTLDSGVSNAFFAIVVGAGENVDGITISPQIEVGSSDTQYESPSSVLSSIELKGVDGFNLEPLREVTGKKTGEVGDAYSFSDKIVLHDGVWAVERNVKEYDLSEVSWTKSTYYMTPYFMGYSIRPGTTSNYVKCTHFAARGDLSSQSAGAWLGNFFVIGNDVLPSGADTTTTEMKSFCQSQKSAGTPVKLCVPIYPPVYEELHQDVQVLLNSITVQGGQCSVWIEGNTLPSYASIGFPRGDFPCSGVEGAYKWLHELSIPLSTPTQDDLYTWALSQQRGGVFTTDGSITTKNVPDSGNLTGILSVMEQGVSVSIIVFSPTGKLYVSNRSGGVWRGWSSVYSSTNKPTPVEIGAVQTVAAYYGSSTADGVFDSSVDSAFIAYLSSDVNADVYNVLKSGWSFVYQLFFSRQSVDTTRIQLAIGSEGTIASRYRTSDGVWRPWSAVALKSELDEHIKDESNPHKVTAEQLDGILSIVNGGTGASTWSDALNNLRGIAKLATYYSDVASVDIDIITDGLALVPWSASKNCPIKGSFVFIMQLFYGEVGSTNNRTQIAFPYTSGTGVAVRTCNSSVWSDWDLLYSYKMPPPTMTGSTSSKDGSSGLVPIPPSGSNTKFLRGDGTWQDTPNTEYDDATTSKSGLMSASDKTKLNGIENKANNYVHPTYTQRSSGIYKITVDSKGHVSAVEQANTGKAARFVIGTSTAGWTLDDCDYLCDGTSDDVEIKSAINALPSGGGEILLLDGTYNIGSQIAMSKASVTLRGSGASTVLKRMFNGSTPNGVVGCSASNCLISCIRIDGNKTAYTSRENRGLYASMSAKNIIIEDVIVDSSYNGMALSGMDGCYVSRCTVRTTSSRGIYMNGVINPTIEGCLVSGNGGDGIVFESCQNIHILNNNVLGIIDTGISIDSGCTGGIIQGNTVDAPRDENSISIKGSSSIVMGNIAGNIYLSDTSKDSIVQNNVVNSSVTERGTNNIVGNNVVVSTEVQA